MVFKATPVLNSFNCLLNIILTPEVIGMSIVKVKNKPIEKQITVAPNAITIYKKVSVGFESFWYQISYRFNYVHVNRLINVHNEQLNNNVMENVGGK